MYTAEIAFNNQAIQVLELELEKRYNISAVRGRKNLEYQKGQCTKGSNFGRTLTQAWESTRNMEAVAVVANVLYDVVEWPAAGTLAWQLRRYMRRAAPEQTMEFAQLLQELVRKDNGKIRKDPSFIDMDGDVYDYGDRIACQQEIDKLRALCV